MTVDEKPPTAPSPSIDAKLTRIEGAIYSLADLASRFAAIPSAGNPELRAIVDEQFKRVQAEEDKKVSRLRELEAERKALTGQ